MPQVGDTVQVQISGGTTLQGGGASIGIGQGASMSVPGKIVQDLGGRWLVQLSMSVGRKNLVEIPK